MLSTYCSTMRRLYNISPVILFALLTETRSYLQESEEVLPYETTYHYDRELRRGQKQDSLIGDVLKNITRVNDILESLIKNYEKLENKVKKGSLESSSPEFMDPETDEEFKNRNNNFSQSVSDSENYTKEVNKLTKMQDTVDSATNIDSKSKQDSREQNNDEILKDRTLKTRTKEKLQSGSGSGEDLSTSSDSEKKKSIEHSYKKRALKDPSKTRFGIQKYSSQAENEDGISIEKPIVNDKTLLLNKDITTEPSTEKVSQTNQNSKTNIWDDIVKLLHVKITERTTASTSKSTNKMVNEPIFRESSASNEKSVLPTSIYKRDKDKLRKKHASPVIPEGSIEDEAIKKEMFKTSVLRKAYGDACLKVIIRKCYKACVAALTETCKSFSCKNKMKPTFKGRAKRYCLREFDGSPKIDSGGLNKNVRNGTENMKNTIVALVPKATLELPETVEKDEDMDITRTGYLAAACLPEPNTLLRPGNSTLETEGKLNILRDRYERACKKESSEKCIKACHDSVDDACNMSGACRGGKKSHFKKHCEKECKASYSVSKGSDSGSSSSNSDSSGSVSATSKEGNDTTKTSQIKTELNKQIEKEINNNKGRRSALGRSKGMKAKKFRNQSSRRRSFGRRHLRT